MKPLTLLIKPAAGLCNMDCKYCFYKAASKDRKNEIMQQKTVNELINKIIEYNPSALSVMFQGGEPTLAGIDFYRSFVIKLKEKIRCPVTFALQTNALLIDDEFAEFFYENAFLIGVSLDGNEKVNSRYRLDNDGKSVFNKVMHAIETLKKHGVEFNILSVIDDENARAVKETYSFFRENGFDYLQFIPFVDEGQGISLSSEEYENFLKNSFDLWFDDLKKGKYISIRHIDNYIGILSGYPPESCAMSGICAGYFVVEANGDIYPCDFYCRGEYKIGCIFDDNPFEIGEKHKEFINESLVIHKYCKDCKYHFICRGGCRKDRNEALSKNRYCKAYYNFFEYSVERMKSISR